MEINFNIDHGTLYHKIMTEACEKLGVECEVVSFHTIRLAAWPKDEDYDQMIQFLAAYGISVIEDPKEQLVQKIKALIIAQVTAEGTRNYVKTSVYLSEELGLSYGYLSYLFSELTLTTIENFVILQKIEVAKQLLAFKHITLTEVAHRLDYSSVAHLSAQFKKTTGLTPSSFRQIMQKRNHPAKVAKDEMSVQPGDANTEINP